MEGIRLNGTFGSYRQATVYENVDDNGRPVQVKPGDKVFCSFVNANREAEYFPDPDTVRIDRPLDRYVFRNLLSQIECPGDLKCVVRVHAPGTCSLRYPSTYSRPFRLWASNADFSLFARYIHYGLGPHACLGGDASRVALTAMLRTVGRLDNLRRAPGPQGELKKIPRPGGFYIYMRADRGSYFPFPTSEFILVSIRT